MLITSQSALKAACTNASARLVPIATPAKRFAVRLSRTYAIAGYSPVTDIVAALGSSLSRTPGHRASVVPVHMSTDDNCLVILQICCASTPPPHCADAVTNLNLKI